MPRYSDERKEAVLRKMLPPHNRPLGELAAEEGISEATLYTWRRELGGTMSPDPTGPLLLYGFNSLNCAPVVFGAISEKEQYIR